MNNKGQTLVLFIIFIPLLLILAAFVIDVGYIASEKTKLVNTTEIILEEDDIQDIEKIRTLYLKNEIEIEEVKWLSDNELYASYHVDSIFGFHVGIKDYKIKTTMQKEE